MSRYKQEPIEFGQSRRDSQQYDRINQARLNELAARKKARHAKNPLSAFFSDMIGEGAEEHEETMTRTFAPYALADGDSIEELKKKVGYPGIGNLIKGKK